MFSLNKKIKRMVFTIENLCDACYEGDIQTVRDIANSKEVDINDTDDTPLMCAMGWNQREVVRFLLTQPELQLDKRDSIGWTALHLGCQYSTDIAVLRLFCQDRRCTPSIVNIKDIGGKTALMLRPIDNKIIPCWVCV